MSRFAESEIDVLTGSHARPATPDIDPSLRSIMLRRDGTGSIISGFGQTIYAEIDCRFEPPEPGRIRFEYLPTQRPQRRPPFQPTRANRRKGIGFTLTECETTFREGITGFGFRFS